MLEADLSADEGAYRQGVFVFGRQCRDYTLSSFDSKIIINRRMG